MFEVLSDFAISSLSRGLFKLLADQNLLDGKSELLVQHSDQTPNYMDKE